MFAVRYNYDPHRECKTKSRHTNIRHLKRVVDVIHWEWTYELEVGKMDMLFAPGIKIESSPVRAGVGVLVGKCRGNPEPRAPGRRL